MGRFDNRWSGQHAAAIVAAVLDQGLPQVQALRQAKTEGLAGLDPFDMPRSTARYYIEQEQRRREQSQAAAASSADIPRTADTILQRALTLCDRELSKLEKASSPDINALDRLAKTAANIKKQAGFAPAPSQEPEAPKPTESTDAQSMLDAMRGQQEGSPNQPTIDLSQIPAATCQCGHVAANHTELPNAGCVMANCPCESFVPTEQPSTNQDYLPHAPAEDEDVRDELSAGV